MSKGKYAKNTGPGGTKPLALLLALALLVGGAVGGTVAWLTATTQKVTNTFTTSNIQIELTETGATAGTETTDQTKNYQMVPGWTLDKNPKVTVKKGSEDCYLFVKVTTTGKATIGNTEYGITDYLAYNLLFDETDSGWTKGEGTGEGKNGVPEDVYYKIVNSPTDKDEDFTLLKGGSFTLEGTTTAYTWADNHVLVKPTVTNEMMAALKENGAVEPSITFTAYASQLWKTNKPLDTASDEQKAAAQFTAAEAWSNVAPAESGT